MSQERALQLWLLSGELVKEWLESCAELGISFLQLADQTGGRHSKRPAQLRLIEGVDKGTCERIGHSGGEPVNATPFAGVLSQAQAGEGERMIANPTDPIFGSPGLVALDTHPGMQDMVPTEPDER